VLHEQTLGREPDYFGMLQQHIVVDPSVFRRIHTEGPSQIPLGREGTGTQLSVGKDEGSNKSQQYYGMLRKASREMHRLVFLGDDSQREHSNDEVKGFHTQWSKLAVALRCRWVTSFQLSAFKP
jgi:hypothetical protein